MKTPLVLTLAALGSAAALESFQLREEPLAPNNVLDVRAACDPLPAGSGPKPSPDTDAAFSSSPVLANAALLAATPPDYFQSFSNLNASISTTTTYLGYSTLRTYNVGTCAKRCNARAGCRSFNIFFERSPSKIPGRPCRNPPSTTIIKCTLWGNDIGSATNKNDGSYQADFHIVMAGSNGYVKKTPPTIPGLEGDYLGNTSINAPLDCYGNDTYMGVAIFPPGRDFDVNLCAAECAKRNSQELAQATVTKPKFCRFFTTYLVSSTKGVPKGQYCAMYTQYWDRKYAINDGEWHGNQRYTYSSAYSYFNTSSPGLPICSSDIAYLQSEGQEFCSSYLLRGLTSSGAGLGYTTTDRPYETVTSVFTTTTTVYPGGVTPVPPSSHASDMIPSTIILGSSPSQTLPATVSDAQADTFKVRSAEAMQIEGETLDASAIVTHSVPNKPMESTTVVPSVTGFVQFQERAVATPVGIKNWEPASITQACWRVITRSTSTTTVPVTTTLYFAVTTETVTIPGGSTTEATPSQPTTSESTTSESTASEPTASDSDTSSMSTISASTASSSETTTSTPTTIDPTTPEPTTELPISQPPTTGTTDPGIILPTSAAIAQPGPDEVFDDYYFSLDLPFAIGAYGVYSKSVSLSINGRISIGEGVEATGIFNPAELPDSRLPAVTIFPYFDDLLLSEGQGIFFQATGEQGARVGTFEWYTSKRDRWWEVNHFLVSFYEDKPGVIDVKYYSVSERGNQAVVGAQNLEAGGGGASMMFSFKQMALADGMSLRMDTTTGDFTVGTFS